MVSKIIALAIALILVLSAPIYDLATANVQSVQYGAGDDEDSVVIEDPEELVTLITTIPDLEEYLDEEESITDKYDDFVSFTMTETGSTKQITGKPTYNEDGDPVYEKKETINEHILTVCFGEESVYYHSKGSTTEQVVYLERDEGNNYGDYNEILDGTRLTKSFDVEIFYSQDVMLVRYNDFDILSQKYKSGDYYEMKFKTVEGDTIAEDVDITMEDIVGAVSKTFGKWLIIESEEDLEDILDFDFEDLEDMDEDEQIEAVTTMMVLEFSQMFSQLWVQETVNSTRANVAYLKGLAGYIAMNVDTNYDQVGNRFVLTGPDEDDFNTYEEYDYARKSFYQNYLNALGLPGYMYDYPTVESYFTVESNKPTLYQYIDLYNSMDGYENNTRIAAYTTFSGIDNTTVDGDDKDIVTVYEAYKQPLGKVLEDYIEDAVDELN